MERFKQLLDEQHQWPGHYTFKFVVPKGQLADVLQLFPGSDYSLKSSSSGTYVSVTFVCWMECSNDVIQVYEKASKIERIVML